MFYRRRFCDDHRILCILVYPLSRSKNSLGFSVMRLSRANLRGIFICGVVYDYRIRKILDVTLCQDVGMIRLRGQDLSAWVRFMFTEMSSMETSERVIICKHSASLMMEGVRMLLELEVCPRIMILLIGLLIIVRNLLTIFRILRGSQIVLFIAVRQLRHNS